MKERTKLLVLIALFAASYYIQWDSEIIRRSGLEAFMMLREYAREHVLTCLIPAFFIAGAIAVFVSQASVLKYFGPQAKKIPHTLLLRCREPFLLSVHVPCFRFLRAFTQEVPESVPQPHFYIRDRQ